MSTSAQTPKDLFGTVKYVIPRSRPALDTATLQGISAVTLPRSYPAETLLFERDDPAGSVILLEEGSLCVQHFSGAEKPADFEIVGPGRLVGALCVFENRPHTTTVRTLTECTIRMVSAETFFRLACCHPTLAETLHLPQ